MTDLKQMASCYVDPGITGDTVQHTHLLFLLPVGALSVGKVKRLFGFFLTIGIFFPVAEIFGLLFPRSRLFERHIAVKLFTQVI